MKIDIAAHWYRKKITWLTFLLQPLSGLFFFMMTFRRFGYRLGLIKSQRFNVPVIVVGNITVGGTGKTPFVMYLADLLKREGFHPGIVSRGVGGQLQKTPRIVTEKSAVNEVGDEAILLAQKTQCPVVIGTDRVAAVEVLLKNFPCDMVISDDGLQHYRLARDVEIILIDGERQLGNGMLLPAGPLRETQHRMKKADFVIFKDDANQKNHFKLSGDKMFSFDQQQIKTCAEFHPKKVRAVAGIGNPQHFFNRLQQQGFDIVPSIFPDHYLFTQNDFQFPDDLPIVMTEKDAVKCKEFADERFWYVPVSVAIDATLEQALLRRIACLK